MLTANVYLYIDDTCHHILSFDSTKPNQTFTTVNFFDDNQITFTKCTDTLKVRGEFNYNANKLISNLGNCKLTYQVKNSSKCDTYSLIIKNIIYTKQQYDITCNISDIDYIIYNKLDNFLTVYWGDNIFLELNGRNINFLISKGLFTFYDLLKSDQVKQYVIDDIILKIDPSYQKDLDKIISAINIPSYTFDNILSKLTIL